MRGARHSEALGDLAALGCLAGFFALAAWLLPLGADVPIGDSALYARSALRWVEQGELRLGDWPAASLVGQLWLAWAVGQLLGARPAALAGLTFALSALTTALLYALLRTRAAPAPLAGFAALAFAANPVWLAQSVTFDTEVYLVFFCAAGLLALARFEASRRGWQLAVACAAFAWAALVRQHALVVCAGALAWRLRAPRDRRLPLLPFALPLLAVAGYYLWIAEVHGFPKEMTWRQGFVGERLLRPWTLLWPLARDLAVSAHYLGLFLLPVLVQGGGRAPALASRRALTAAAALAVALLTVALARLPRPPGAEPLMPYGPNILGLAPLFRPLASRMPVWLEPLHVQLAFTLVSGLGAVLLLRRAALAALALAQGRRLPAPFDCLLLASAALLLGFGALTGVESFDRYFLVPLAFLLPLLVPGGAAAGPVAPRKGWRWAGALALLGLQAALALHFVDQRMRLHGCPFDLARALVAQGADPRSIDGGFEFNAYYNYDWYSETRGRELETPWAPLDAPDARVAIRLQPLGGAGLERVGLHRCENRAGLDPILVWVYRVGPP